ncbi:hypothetical protein ILUMI_20497 [Ignelater luminosus]|uniref:Uncharacterized protein n=1 Tax=Ignelater luminosus TaxID=2038154 RepID=A0A8K0G4I5_IGNLU|nr:hypothetical protein ILUMI_20497 [Ignelater luminosus]
MNEPTVFNKNESFEMTLPPDLIHHNGIAHRKVHNIYGFYQTMATLEGLLYGKTRPFILTRSHFAGSQRYAAVWTGENYASWEHLRISLPMCLSEALAGISFCGADVGGFNGIPDDELYIRWYQAGAWLPFYRGSYAFNVPQREPILYPESIQDKIRSILRLRYAHTPLWYLLFRQHEKTGEPVIRPLIYHYPGETETLHIDDEILIGPNVLAVPVLEPGVRNRRVYLPGGQAQIWYNIDDNYKIYYGSGYQMVPVNLDSTPVFYRGGSIIPRKNTQSNSATVLRWDYYTIYISPDSNGDARGSLYDDDYKTHDYKDYNQYTYVDFTFSKNVLTSKVDKAGLYKDSAKIERLVILNPPKGLGEAKCTSGKEVVTTKEVVYLYEERILEITFGYFSAINIEKEFKVEFGKSDTDSSNPAANFRLTTSIKVFLFVIISRIVIGV